MKRIVIYCLFSIFLSQIGYTQTERTVTPIYFDISGYNDIPTLPPSGVLMDTISTIKAEMNVDESGALTYMVPIDIIKGNNNFQPNVSLRYHSNSGDGIAGFGWDIIGLSSITQGGKSQEIDGITTGPQYNQNDPFYLDGLRLLKTSTTTYVTEKYSKIKITKQTGNPEYSFVVQYIDGKVAKYKELTSGQHFISLMIDSFGNEIHYSYTINNNLIYIDTISYGGNSVANDKFFINFVYATKDLYSTKLYRNNMPHMITKYLSEIKVSSTYLPQNNGLYRKYLLSYDKIRNGTTERLIKIEVENETGLYLKPLLFNYNAVDFSEVVSTINTFPNIIGEIRGLGDVAVGDFYGTGEPVPLYEVKNSENKYNLVSPKTGYSIPLNGLSKNSKKYYSGKVLYNDSILTISDDLIILDIEYLSPGQSTGVIDKLKFMCKNLTTNKTKTITIELPGDVHTLGNQYDGHDCHDVNGVKICPGNNHRNMTERDIIVGDFNNDGLTDVFIIQPGNNNHIRTTYFFELGKFKQDTFVLHTVTGFTGYNIHYNANNKIQNIYPIEFDGDGIPELLFIRKGDGDQYNHFYYYSVVKFDYLQKKFIPIQGFQDIQLTNFEDGATLIFGDFNGDGLTDFLTPNKVYKVEGSTAAEVLKKINTEPLMWTQYTSTGTEFIKSQRNFTQQKLAYIAPSQRNIIKRASSWDKFWSGAQDSYQYTEYGGSHIIATDFDNDGKTDLISVRKFGKVKYSSSQNLKNSTIENLNTFMINSEVVNNEYANKIFFHRTKTIANGNFTFSNLDTTLDISNTKISPFSLLLSYTDYNYLNRYKSGIFIHDILTRKEHRHIVDSDHFNEILIREINNGSPVTQKIEFKSMLEKTNDRKEDVYTTSDTSITYPYYKHKNQGSHYLVYKIHTTFDDNIVTREYRYQDGIQNLSGKGFQGFRKTFVSDPYESKLVNGKYIMKNIFEGHFWTTNEYDPFMENAPIVSYHGSLNPNSVFNRTEKINEMFDMGNNRYMILPVSEINYDFLKDVTISKIYDYDETNSLLLKKIITDYDGISSSIEDFFYKSENTSNENYFFGQISKIETTALRGGSTFFTKEEREYNTNGTINNIKNYSNNSTAVIKDYTYYPFGEIHTENVSTTGISPLTTTYEYDTTNRFVKKVTTPEGLVTNYTVNALGRILSEVSPLNQTTTYKYDAWGNVKQVKDYLGKETNIFKDGAFGESLGYYSVTSEKAGGETVVSIRDVFDREIKTKRKTLNNQWVVTETQYDILGRKIAESEPYLQGGSVLWNTTEYDDINRPVKNTIFNGKIITTCYEGNKVTVEDGHRKVIRWIDATGLVYKHQDEGGTIFYKYHPNGSLKETDYDGIKTTIEIDDWGNKKKLIEPSAGTYQYEYDNLGNIKKETNPKGGVTQYTYDNFGKLISENTNSSSENTNIIKNYSYDPSTKLPTVTSGSYNGNSYTYTTFYDDPYYRITGKKEETPDFIQETSITYDSFGRVDETEIKTTLTNPSYVSTTTVKNEYDTNGILIEQLDGSQSIWEVNNINGYGLVTQMAYGNGYILNTTYNNSNLHLEEINHSKNGQSVLNITYNYDSTKGILLSRNNLVFGKNETYTYDELDRLLEERVNNVLTKEYTYDKRGRMTYNSDVGKLNFYNQNYKLQNIDFNENGVDLEDERGFAEITYNAFKNPNEIFLEGKDRISYEYSILRTRSKAYYGSLDEDETQRPNFKLYSSDKAIEVIKTENTTKVITYLTGDPYTANYMKVDEFTGSTLQNSGKYFIHRDNQGTILAITNAGSNGEAIERRYFDAWGNLVEAKLGNNSTSVFPNDMGWISGLMFDRGYTGHEHLTTVGLIHMNGRIYDSVLRRFMSPDNFVQDTYNTQNYNRYSYVKNNPLLYTDPSGEFIFTIFTGVIDFTKNFIKNGVNFHKYNWHQTEMALKIDKGLFSGSVFDIISKWTWQYNQTMLGNFVNHVINLSGNVSDVTHMDGAVAVARRDDKGAFTLGNYISGPRGFRADWRDHLFVHEYGHYIQSKWMGPLYLSNVGIPSLFDYYLEKDGHHSRWYEAMASSLGGKYFDKHYGSGANGYVEGSIDYFDLHSYITRFEPSPYINPRTGDRNEGANSSHFTIHWSDLGYFLLGKIF